MCKYILYIYIFFFGSGMFALLRYIYVQAFEYCPFLEKELIENMLHVIREPVAVSDYFFLLLIVKRIYVYSDRTILREDEEFLELTVPFFLPPLFRFSPPPYFSLFYLEESCFLQSLFRNVRIRNEINSPKRH